ncbi:MAG: NAD-dependent epimerase/dehydratase family protein [Rhizomicrobium sp.]
MNEVAVVFGGAGFIGTHLCGRLVSGRSKVIAVDIREPINPVPGVEYRIADVRDLTNFQVDGEVRAVFNLAAVHTTPGHPDHEYYETNIIGAVEISNFATRQSCKEIIFTSSISVYGPGEDPKTESTKLNPTSAYGRSKMVAEKIHLSWLATDTSNRLLIVRPAVIFGFGEGGNFTRMAKLLSKGIFIYPGRRDAVKACFYVDDLLDAMDFARSKNQRAITFNGCYPDGYSLEQIVETFRAHYFRKARTVTIPTAAVSAAAKALKPFSRFGLGIHPDRVLKLIVSTNIVPQWLSSQGFSRRGRIKLAFDRWAEKSGGRFI